MIFTFNYIIYVQYIQKHSQHQIVVFDPMISMISTGMKPISLMEKNRQDQADILIFLRKLRKLTSKIQTYRLGVQQLFHLLISFSTIQPD